MTTRALTQRPGDMLRLASGARVLDVASGRGASAIHPARQFDCWVLGVDGTAANVGGRDDADRAGLHGRVTFSLGDAERLPVRMPHSTRSFVSARSVPSRTRRRLAGS